MLFRLGEIMNDDYTNVVLSVGGSCINPDGIPDIKFVTDLAKLLKKSPHNFGILTGGGKAARIYAEAARKLGASEFDADEVAILSTRQNAMLLLNAVKDIAYPVILHDFNDARKAATLSRIVIMGGTIPGITTDTDAALFAEAIGAHRLVNISNVSGIYDRDPKKDPKAKKYDTMYFDELVAIASEADKRKAGTNFVFDILACKLVARSKIETHFVSKDIEEIKKAINGRKHSGTVVT